MIINQRKNKRNPYNKTQGSGKYQINKFKSRKRIPQFSESHMQSNDTIHITFNIRLIVLSTKNKEFIGQPVCTSSPEVPKYIHIVVDVFLAFGTLVFSIL